MSAGTWVITGATVSCTCTLNEAGVLLPFPSLAVHWTEVVPIEKVDPEGGVHPTARFPVTASFAVGNV